MILSPLRTVRAFFKAPRSSISKALLDRETHQHISVLISQYQMGATMRYRLWAHQLEKSLPSSAFPHKRCWSKILVKRHQLEVGPLSCEARFEPLSISLQYGLRFFQPPLPTSLSAYLTVRFPDSPGEIRAYHVPLEYLRGLSLAYLPMVQQL